MSEAQEFFFFFFRGETVLNEMVMAVTPHYAFVKPHRILQYKTTTTKIPEYK